MGIDGGGKLIWSADCLTAKNIHDIHRHLATNLSTRTCRIDVDVRNIMCIHARGKPYQEAVCILAKYLKRLAHCGNFFVTTVLDGNIRPDCKRTSIKNKAMREISKIDAYFCRQSAISLSSVITEDNKLKIDKFNTAAKKLELCSSKPSFPSTFAIDLECKLRQIGAFDPNSFNNGIVNEDIIQAKFQADLFLAHRYINKTSDFILSNDSDFSCYAGPNSIMIKSAKVYSKVHKKGSEEENHLGFFSISGTSNNQMKDIQIILPTSEIIWKEAQFPLFDYSDHWVRALCAVTLGCDTYTSGVIGLGPAKLYKAVTNIYDSTLKDSNFTSSMRESLGNHILAVDVNGKLDRESLFTLASAFLNEPVLRINHPVDEVYQYLHNEPLLFPKYLEYFRHPKSSSSSVVDGPCLLTCQGYHNVIQSHNFLRLKVLFNAVTVPTHFLMHVGIILQKKNVNKYFVKERHRHYVSNAIA